MQSSTAVYLRDCFLSQIYLKSLFLDINIYPCFCYPDINLNGSIWIYSVCTDEETEHSLLLCTHGDSYRFSALGPSCSVTQTCTQQPIKGSSSGHRLVQRLFVQMEQGRSASFDNFWLPAIPEAGGKKTKTKQEYNNVTAELLSCFLWECK